MRINIGYRLMMTLPLVFPNSASMLDNDTPTLTWNEVTLPTGVVLADYEIQIANNATFTSGLHFTSGLQTFIVATNAFTPSDPTQRKMNIKS